jgi:hypothetical protein
VGVVLVVIAAGCTNSHGWSKEDISRETRECVNEQRDALNHVNGVVLDFAHEVIATGMEQWGCACVIKKFSETVDREKTLDKSYRWEMREAWEDAKVYCLAHRD